MRIAWLGLLLALSGCYEHPNVTLQAPPRPAIEAQQVRVLTSLPPPGSYQVMGRVYGWSPVPVDTSRGYDMAVEKLRERAGSIGANAVVVPKREEIGWPRIQAIWMWPDASRRDDDFEDSRPTELMGQALFTN